MALEHAILVSLAEQSATGYELARRFDASIGHFWTASHQQIYRVLGRMESDGWVTAQMQAQSGKPDKKTYAITADGRTELASWSSEPSPHEVIRSDFTVKLRGFADPAALLRDTQRRRAEHVDRLERFENSQARHYPDPSALSGPDLGAYLALRGGISQENHGIAWCDEILAALAPALAPTLDPGAAMNTFQKHAEESFATGTGFERVGELLADDVVFHSPVAYKPYEGRPIVAAILRAVARVFEDFTYVSTIEEDNRTALIFRTKVGDTEVHGVDLIETNDEGLITSFTVMVRPQSGALALKEAMGAQFEQIQAEAMAEMQAQSQAQQ